MASAQGFDYVKECSLRLSCEGSSRFLKVDLDEVLLKVVFSLIEPDHLEVFAFSAEAEGRDCEGN